LSQVDSRAYRHTPAPSECIVAIVVALPYVGNGVIVEAQAAEIDGLHASEPMSGIARAILPCCFVPIVAIQIIGGDVFRLRWASAQVMYASL